MHPFEIMKMRQRRIIKKCHVDLGIMKMPSTQDVMRDASRRNRKEDASAQDHEDTSAQNHEECIQLADVARYVSAGSQRRYVSAEITKIHPCRIMKIRQRSRKEDTSAQNREDTSAEIMKIRQRVDHEDTSAQDHEDASARGS
jgi:hypothetical protein